MDDSSSEASHIHKQQSPESDLEKNEHEDYSIHTATDFDPSGVKRGLKSRHLSMMALAGIIGPGLLVGAGQALNEGGPASLLIGFSVIGLIAAAVMQSVGEMSTMFPEGGFIAQTHRFVNRAAAFTVGWNYFIVWIAVMANEYNALSSVLSTWSDRVPIYGYFLIFWFFFLAFQFLGVASFGEAEFWLALFKIAGLTAYFIFSIVYVSGGIHNHPAFGFHYFHDPGAFATGFRGVAKVFVFCSTFYAGTESIAMAATETRNPVKAMPIAVRQTMGRILFVYLGSALFFGMTCPWNSPGLNSQVARALKSPMSIAIANAGWYGGYNLINTFLLITCLSGINSCIYIGSRTVFFMAQSGLAPKFFLRTTRWGVPYYAVIFMNLFGFLSLMNISQGAATAYNYIVNLSGVSTFIVWGIIELTHLRFRYAWKYQGYYTSDLLFKGLLVPWSTWFGLILNVFLAFVQSWTSFSPWNVGNFIDGYILLPLSLVAYLGFAWYDRQIKWNKAEVVDLQNGRRTLLDQDDYNDEDEPDHAKKGFKARLIKWMKF